MKRDDYGDCLHDEEFHGHELGAVPVKICDDVVDCTIQREEIEDYVNSLITEYLDTCQIVCDEHTHGSNIEFDEGTIGNAGGHIHSQTNTDSQSSDHEHDFSVNSTEEGDHRHTLTINTSLTNDCSLPSNFGDDKRYTDNRRSLQGDPCTACSWDYVIFYFCGRVSPNSCVAYFIPFLQGDRATSPGWFQRVSTNRAEPGTADYWRSVRNDRTDCSGCGGNHSNNVYYAEVSYSTSVNAAWAQCKVLCNAAKPYDFGMQQRYGHTHLSSAANDGNHDHSLPNTNVNSVSHTHNNPNTYAVSDHSHSLIASATGTIDSNVVECRLVCNGKVMKKFNK